MNPARIFFVLKAPPEEGARPFELRKLALGDEAQDRLHENLRQYRVRHGLEGATEGGQA